VTEPTAHVVWDWNGTLLDDFGLSVDAARHACRRVEPAAHVDHEAYRRHFTRPVRTFYERLLGRALTDDQWSDIAAEYHGYYESRVADAPIRSGAREVIGRLNSAGVSQSVLSMSDAAHLGEMLAARALDKEFLVVEGTDPAVRTEKKERLLRAHVETVRGQRPGLGLDDFLLVGDTTDDAVAAAAVGVPRVILRDGCFDGAELAALNTATVETLAEAVRIGLPRLGWH
jgi:phosphoglycolate phosphatase-like HAD superfamily hydrolase